MGEIPNSSGDDHSLIAVTAIRCAKAAILLSTLKRSLNSNNSQQIQLEGENEEVEMLKMELLKEKVKNKKMKLCSKMELCLRIVLLLSLWTLCLLLSRNLPTEIANHY